MHWPEFRLDLEDAWQDVCARPFRSALSAVGISIGVLALVAMMSITAGAREEALASARSLDLDTVRFEQGPTLATSRAGILRARDAAHIEHTSGYAVDASYFYRHTGTLVQSSKGSTSADRFAVPESFFTVERLTVARGLPWTPNDSGVRCVIGPTLAQRLSVDLGDTVVVDDMTCPITGVLAAHPPLLTEGTGLGAIDFDTSLFMPYTDVLGRDPEAPVTGIVCRVGVSEPFNAAVEAIATALAAAHDDERPFVTVVPRQLAEQVSSTQRLFAWIMSTIAGLALLVGGIGIANALLATIAEQTREIGLRMAVGAHPARVLILYVLHAGWICGMGALVGAALGLLVAVAVQWAAQWQVQLSLLSVAVGIFFALATGALSATYPAYRASRMSPAAALVDH